jgi:hypothetical protein
MESFTVRTTVMHGIGHSTEHPSVFEGQTTEPKNSEDSAHNFECISVINYIRALSKRRVRVARE